MTIFREVWVSSGSPDLVVVFWDPRIFSSWKSNRPSLGRRTLKVLHFIYSQTHASVDVLKSIYGDRVRQDADLLVSAGMATYDANGYRAVSVSDSYAVRAIAAVEAKISRWSSALEQAVRNQWFASHSYVLLPNIPTSAGFAAHPMKDAIHVITKDVGVPSAFGAGKASPPTSYMSWLFNEWLWEAWRHVNLEH